MYKYIIISILLLFTGCATTSPIWVPSTPVTFINENPGETILGLAQLIVDEDGNIIDYKIMNMRWDYKLYVIDLKPGVYGVTQYVPEYYQVIAFQMFEVGKDPMIVRFRKL